MGHIGHVFGRHDVNKGRSISLQGRTVLNERFFMTLFFISNQNHSDSIS
jgi:hypothetical protein